MPHLYRLAVRCLLVLACTLAFAARATPWRPLHPARAQHLLGPGDENWRNGLDLAGVNGRVYATVVAPNGDLYVGGLFTVAGSVAASNVARWNGRTWQALGSGTNGVLYTLALDRSGNLYAGGAFTTAGGQPASNVARWNGTAWTALGSGTDSGVLALTVDSQGSLVAGGYFTTAGSQPASHVARWNGSTWANLGSGLSRNVAALTINAVGTMYAGENNGISGEVWQWTGNAWSSLGNAGIVKALAVDDNGLLYAGTTGGVVRQNSGTATWTRLGSNLEGKALAIAFVGGTLYAGGYFGVLDGSRQLLGSNVARWDGAVWQPMGASLYNDSPSMSDVVYALAGSATGTLYAGGYLTPSTDSPGRGITRWDGTRWRVLGSGLASVVNSLVPAGPGTFYAAGYFPEVSGQPTAYVARWDGLGWTALGAAPPGPVYMLTRDAAGTLYAAGSLRDATGSLAAYVARWNGSTWTTLGTFTNPGGSYVGIYALAADSQGNLYAGGYFATAGGTAVSNVARWTGTAWAPLGAGVNRDVLALAPDGSGGIYAGGYFTTAGGQPAGYVARWTGTAWQTLGAGTTSNVQALVADNSGGVYMASGFGAGAPRRLARWSGNSWTDLPHPAPSGSVFTLALDGAGTLYAGGFWPNPSGAAAMSSVASWDGTAWHTLGSGLDGEVYALAPDDLGGVAAGGSFITVGDKSKVTAFFAHYRPGGFPLGASTALPADDGLHLYPNPAAAGGSATLALPADLRAQPLAAELLNGLGQVVRRYALPAGRPTHPLDLRQLPAGLYTLRLPAGGRGFSRKLLVQ